MASVAYVQRVTMATTARPSEMSVQVHLVLMASVM